MKDASHASKAVLTAIIIGALGGCNSLTGADEILLDPGFREADDNSSASTGGPTGGGGDSAVATASATTSSTGGGASSTGTGGSTAPTPCEYPTGPYGVDVGDTLPPTLSWQGFTPGADSPSTVTITDFFDCDGTRGINAVFFDTSQFG